MQSLRKILKKENKEVLEINIDTIRELRLRGEVDKADELVKAFRKDVEKNKKQIVNEINRRNYKIKKFKKICVTPSCYNDTEGLSLCEKCRHLSNKAKRLSRKRMKKHDSTDEIK